MESEIVYIRKIEGTVVWIPVKARRVNHSHYEILDDKEFHDLDKTDVLTNFPGDIVTLQEHEFPDGEVGKIVNELVYRPNG